MWKVCKKASSAGSSVFIAHETDGTVFIWTGRHTRHVWNDYETKVINQERIEKINQENSKIYAINFKEITNG